MADLMHPAILNDLGHAGEAGLPRIETREFEQELQMCREWGFRLQTEASRVSLSLDPDQLVPAWIQKETPAIAWNRLHVRGFLSLDSTNSTAVSLAMKGAPAGTLVLSEEQTAGRGRKNRVWFSHRGAGLCCSLILRPRQAHKYWPLLTLATSIALVDTLRDLTHQGILALGPAIDIKWPNDVLLSGRKCAGILLETLMNDAEGPSAIVGFGINVRKENIPDSLAAEAIALDEVAIERVPRRKLLVRFLNYFQLCYQVFERGNHRELLERWKQYSSMWNGVPVLIGEENNQREAITCGLTEMGALIVRRPDGSRETVLAETIRLGAGAHRPNS